MITLVKYVLIAILVFIINVILVAFELYWIADMFTPMIIIICTGIIYLPTLWGYILVT